MNDYHKEIEKIISKKPIILFMKGSKLMPLCGFSSSVVDILKTYSITFETMDVLQDNDLRTHLKTYTNWPTFPQLYVQGEFVGGCDIIMQLHSEGELKKILEKEQ